jgi:hypothetical protein
MGARINPLIGCQTSKTIALAAAPKAAPKAAPVAGPGSAGKSEKGASPSMAALIPPRRFRGKAH